MKAKRNSRQILKVNLRFCFSSHKSHFTNSHLILSSFNIFSKDFFSPLFGAGSASSITGGKSSKYQSSSPYIVISAVTTSILFFNYLFRINLNMLRTTTISWSSIKNCWWFERSNSNFLSLNQLRILLHPISRYTSSLCKY